MIITDETSDALELVRELHRQMNVMRSLMDELEYLVYRCDERCKIEFFGKGKNDEGRGQKGTKAD